MQYTGGKYRIAARIEKVILDRREGRVCYAEPFLGGAAVFSRVAPHFTHAYGSDVVPDLILMWQAAQAGWVPPESLSEDEYRALRDAEPSALRGFAGFGCSFGGKWFGGYARSRNGAAPGYDYVAGSGRTVRKQAAAMAGARLECTDYRTLSFGANAVVYCDPPYSGTTGYKAAGSFDAGEFWATAEKWAGAGAMVLVSEYQAPAGWECVWERAMPNYLRGDAQKSGERMERVFMLTR